jgi:O-antigen biosynthesis protein
MRAVQSLGRGIWYWAARAAGAMRLARARPAAAVAACGEPGTSVVVPSRNGRALLETLLPGVARDLAGMAAEIIVVDNGSSDGTADWLREAWPDARVAVSEEPLSFAAAVNRGIARARFSHVCLLNNDMVIQRGAPGGGGREADWQSAAGWQPAPLGFFGALRRAFDGVPDLFCATAQIRFPEGVRREETGKAVLADYGPEEFPVRCEEPLEGEDGTPVLYGSGGCSLYDAAKLRALGSMNEEYAPAYVEDMELGYRAWQRGWPSVYVAGAAVEHRHRATTSRYYTGRELEAILEINYLKFLAGNVADERVFGRLWGRAIERLRRRAARGEEAAASALRAAAGIALRGACVPDMEPGAEEEFLALTGGAVAAFPGAGELLRAGAGPGGPAQAWRPAPLGSRVMAVGEAWAAPSREMLEQCAEVVVVRGEEGSAAFRAARRWAAGKSNTHQFGA